jgi:hypothetical protein
MPGLQDSFSGNPQRAWQRRANPVHVKLALGSRIQGADTPPTGNASKCQQPLSRLGV